MEEWRDIKKYEGLYVVSNAGRIKKIVGDEHCIIHISESDLWFEFVRLRKMFRGRMRARTKTIHHLVAESFLPNPEQNKSVRHRNGNRNKNYPWNLEWVACSELTARKYGSDHHRSKVVRQMTRSGVLLARHANVREASIDTGINAGTIYSHICGAAMTAGGYVWKYEINI
jgi:hypothetical protein